jgi:CubicO group peptidase (beta-lactamase class C family)
MAGQRLMRFLLAMVMIAGALLPGKTGDAAQSSSEMYHDPLGRFSFPVPAEWTVEERDGYLVLVDPDGDLTFSIVVTQGEDAREGIAAAWELIDSAFDGVPLPGTDQDFPAEGNIDETVILTYDIGQTSGQIIQAIGQRVGDENFVIIIQGSLEAATRRDSQVQLIAAGFTIGETETADLSGIVPAPFEGVLTRAFTGFVQDIVSRGELPGASVVVVQNGEIVYAEGFGVKTLGSDDPVTPDTLMMIGSVSKSFTTTMMASMVDDGLFAWDTPVVDVLPGFAFSDPELTAEITMRNLVCACTGVPRRDLELIFNANEMTAEELVASLAGFEVFTDFGEAFQYSNQMVATGGYAAASAAGAIYGDLDDGYTQELQRRVLDPLGMQRSTLSYLEASIDADVASPHGMTLTGDHERIPLETEAILEPAKPSSTLWSTATELGSYLIMQLNDGIGSNGSIVASAENLAETREPQVEVTTTIDYGLGWFTEDYQGLQIISHGGNTFGFTSYLAFIPEAELGIALLVNAQGVVGFGEALQTRLLELVYDLPAEIEGQVEEVLDADNATPVANAPLEPATIGDPPSREEVSGYLGTYSEPRLGEITLTLTEESGLQLDAGEFVAELRPVTGDAAALGNFVMFDGPGVGAPLRLQMNSDNEPEVIIASGSDRYTFVMMAPGPIASPVPEASPEASPPAG